jgi:nucleoside 2-deoxyribosyltransferase
VIDPMDFDCRGREGDMAADIIKHDLERLDEADIVLVNAERPSWGTAMELVYARQGGKPAIVFVGIPRISVSPWLRGHSSKVCGTLAQACFEIVNFYRA